MRAKFRITKITKSETSVQLEMQAVTSKPFDANGNSEDNSFSRWTPSGKLEMAITNPALFDKFTEGQAFYLDFTAAES